MEKLTNQKEIRRLFWETYTELQKKENHRLFRQWEDARH
jgi:hypothetical protein